MLRTAPTPIADNSVADATVNTTDWPGSNAKPLEGVTVAPNATYASELPLLLMTAFVGEPLIATV
jgi:hypothetical protein